MSHTLFISDLHLDASHPQQVEWFIELLKNEQGNADAIYILGDLFEYWIGDDDLTPTHLNIINAMQQCTSNDTPLFIMQGNRDFLLGSKFCQRTGAKLLPDPCMINIYNKNVLLSHGDLLCTLDKSYQRYRTIVHNVILQSIFLWLPLFVRRWIANKFRNSSKQHNQQKDSALMDVNPETLQQWIDQHEPDIFIYGHVHKPKVARTKNTDVIVLGDWHEQTSWCKINEQGTFSLHDKRVTPS